MSIVTDEEHNKWWKLRNGNPPVMAREIGVRFGRGQQSIREYLKKRAADEGVELPDKNGKSV